MLDINRTLDLVKLKFFNEWLYTSHLYDEVDVDFQRTIVDQVVKDYVDPIKLKKNARILDIGCDTGYFLDVMKKKKYTNVTGITLSENNAKDIRARGLDVKEYDPCFLPQSDGFTDESVDFIFLRHTLQHSPYPIFNLIEYNRLLKQGAKMYIEVPAPDCDRKHEYNNNHYSIMGVRQLDALLQRTGFKLDRFNDMEFELSVTDRDTNQESKIKEHYYAIVVTKLNMLDIK